MPSRKPAVAIIVVVIDSPHAKGHYRRRGLGAGVQAHRGCDPAYLGIGPNLNPPPPVIVARHDTPEMAPTPVAAPLQTDQAPDPVEPGQMPDLHGLSAREALRAR